MGCPVKVGRQTEEVIGLLFELHHVDEKDYKKPAHCPSGYLSLLLLLPNQDLSCVVDVQLRESILFTSSTSILSKHQHTRPPGRSTCPAFIALPPTLPPQSLTETTTTTTAKTSTLPTQCLPPGFWPTPSGSAAIAKNLTTRTSAARNVTNPYLSHFS